MPEPSQTLVILAYALLVTVAGTSRAVKAGAGTRRAAGARQSFRGNYTSTAAKTGAAAFTGRPAEAVTNRAVKAGQLQAGA